MILEKIRKIDSNISQIMIAIGLVLVMFLLPIPQVFVPDIIGPIEAQSLVLMYSTLYFFLIFIVEAVNKRLDFKSDQIILLCIVGLTLIGLASVFVSEDKIVAIEGTIWRKEGFITLLSYYVIFYVTTLLKNERIRRWMVYIFLILGIVVSVMGIFQFTGIYTFGNAFGGMAYVPMGNPNFYGAFSVMFTGTAIGGFFSENKTKEESLFGGKQIVWYILILLGYSACICCSSSLVYVGLVMMFLMFFFLELKTKRRKFYLLIELVVGLIAIILIFDGIREGAVTREITSVGSQIKDEGTLFGDSVGTGRMQIIKNVVKLLPEYGWGGCGIECLGTVWIERYGPTSFGGTYVDKVHNEYLNLWVTEGIFALVIYLIFLFALFIPGVKQYARSKKNKSENHDENIVSKVVFFAFFGYIAQAFFNISVIHVAPYFWMICGLLYSRKRNVDEETMDC